MYSSDRTPPSPPSTCKSLPSLAIGENDLVREVTFDSSLTTGTLINLALELVSIFTGVVVRFTSVGIVTFAVVGIAVVATTLIVVFISAGLVVMFVGAGLVVAFVGAAAVVPVLFVLGKLAFNDTRDQSIQVFSPQHVYVVWILLTMFLAS